VLREDLGLAYSVSTSISFFEDVGDLAIAAGLDEENLDRALALIQKELRDFASIPVRELNSIVQGLRRWSKRLNPRRN